MTPMTAMHRDVGALRPILVRILSEVDRFPLPVLQLMFRVAVAAVFFKSGLTKIASWELTVQLFQDEYAVPLLPVPVAATLAAVTELSMPVLLVLGLGARLAALPLLGMTLVIQLFVYPENWAEHLMWGSLLLFIVTRGAGALSLDRLVRRAVLDGRM
jgi:putative oxidoreductase